MAVYTLFNKSGEQKSLLLRRCTVHDIPEILLLQDQVEAALPDRNIFVKTTDIEIRESILLDYCVGAFDQGNLAGFTLMIYGRVTPRNLGTYFGYGEEQLRGCVTYDTAFVDPCCRGFGLQRLFSSLRNEEAIRCGAREAFATVSPDNLASLKNTLANGFEIVETRIMYTGVVRHILRKTIS